MVVVASTGSNSDNEARRWFDDDNDGSRVRRQLQQGLAERLRRRVATEDFSCSVERLFVMKGDNRGFRSLQRWP